MDSFALILTCSGFWVVINTIITHIIVKRQAKEERESISKTEFDAIARGVRGMLYGELEKKCSDSINAGEITAAELNDMRKYYYEPYVDLHGDGTIAALWRRVESLPLKHAEREVER